MVCLLIARYSLQTDAKSVPDKEMTEKRGKPTMSRKLLQLKVSQADKPDSLKLALFDAEGCTVQ